MAERAQRFEIKSTEAAWNGPRRPANGAGGTWWGWQKIGPQMVESGTWLRVQLTGGLRFRGGMPAKGVGGVIHTLPPCKTG
jgi:hypothetical protein